jgi:hypothetical protein
VGSQPEVIIPPYFWLLGPSILGEGACGQKYSVEKNVKRKQKDKLTGSGS